MCIALQANNYIEHTRATGARGSDARARARRTRSRHGRTLASTLPRLLANEHSNLSTGIVGFLS